MPHHRAQPDSFSMVSGWCCPVCNSTAYQQTLVAKPNGEAYKTEFFECSGCTLMFRHPGRFTRLGLPVRRWAMDVGPRTLREAHGFATAQQQSPTNEEIGPGGPLRDGKI